MGSSIHEWQVVRLDFANLRCKSSYSFIFSSIHWRSSLTRANTVYFLVSSSKLHVADPQLTTPSSEYFPLASRHTRGPPLSPWQPDFSFPGLMSPAHTISLVTRSSQPIMPSSCFWQTSFETSGSWACCRRGNAPPGCWTLPQPAGEVCEVGE